MFSIEIKYLFFITAFMFQLNFFGIAKCDTVDVEQFDSLRKENYVILLSSMNQGDIGVIKSILNNAHIDYYLSGENFLTVEPLIQPAKFHVNVNDLETAAELLKGYNLNPWGAS